MPRPIDSCGVASGHGLALPVDFAGRAGVDGGQDLDEGGLAGAVLADDGVDLALLEGQVDAFQRMRRAEALVELFEDEDRRAEDGAAD